MRRPSLSIARQPVRLPPAAPGDRDGCADAPARAHVAALRRQIEALFADPEYGVYGIDSAGRATLVTASAAAITGHNIDDLVGRGMHEVLHHSHANGDGYPRERCPIYAAFRDGRVHRAEEVFWRKDGTSFPVEYTSAPLVQGGDVVGAVVTFRDLTAERAARALIDETLGRLEESRALQRDRQAAPEPRLAVGQSPAWLSAMDVVRRVAGTDTTVLLVGESGTGKELVARALHDQSGRRGRPLVRLNCAALPAALIESELFGHERGAFTGATAQRIGRFEQADGGTLFLDEVGELSLEAQAKLLRVLQEREFERVGGSRTLRTDARVVAATNRDLRRLVAEGRFRADLYYRLSVFPVRLPPLRERREDILLLARHFLRTRAERLRRRLDGFTPESERRLLGHDWPGNVRELAHVVERAAILAEGPLLEASPLGEGGPASSSPSTRACDCGRQPTPWARAGADDRAAMIDALERAHWKVTGPRGAAATLGVHPNTLRYRMRRLGVRRPR